MKSNVKKKTINQRKKGTQFETTIAQRLKPKFPFVKTSRNESKSLDDRKVDLVNTDPYRIQCKAVENLGSAHNVLSDMDKAMLEHESGINVVVHKKNRKGIIVSMWFDDFLKIID